MHRTNDSFLSCDPTWVLFALLAGCGPEFTLKGNDDANGGANDTGAADESGDDGSSQDTETGQPSEDSDSADPGSGDSAPTDSELEDSGRPDSASTDTGSDDTGGDDTGGSADDLVEICYDPLVVMYSGELYLDGSLFTSWDSHPADEAAEGDTEMCATVEVIVGEEMKMNAWFMEDAASDVQWAAYNNWCESIDWQGILTVDGTEVATTTAPWSEEEWETNPCDIGGDAFFTIP